MIRYKPVAVGLMRGLDDNYTCLADHVGASILGEAELSGQLSQLGQTTGRL